MKRDKTVIPLISLLVLSCGQQQRQLKVTYLSDPPGAVLYKQNGEPWGPCPKVLWYDLSEEDRASGELQAKGLVVRWPNGEEKRSQDKITFEIDGSEKQFVFARPDKTGNGQQMPDKGIKTAAIDDGSEQRDPGLLEEPDEPAVTVAKVTENEDTEQPVVNQVLEQADDTRHRTEKDSGLREEPDEETIRISRADTYENSNEGIIEIPSNANQIRSERDTGIREEPEGTQGTDRIETTVPVEKATSGKTEQIDPSQSESESVTKAAADPNEEIVQIELETGTVRWGNGVEMDFVKIPAGEFTVKAKGNDADSDSTQRITISSPFFMGKYEVTQKQYETIMGVNPAQFDSDPNNPVETVSWYDSVTFCEKLSTKKDLKYPKLKLKYPGLKLKFRLPTEAEWEYACRAGSTTTYYWGDDFDSDYAHTIEDRSSGTEKVKTSLPNAWGLYEMSGNVWEWCSDWYIDPEYPSDRDFRILRGGSWSNSQRSCGCANRNWHTPNHRYDDCGFRVVMEVGSPSD